MTCNICGKHKLHELPTHIPVIDSCNCEPVEPVAANYELASRNIDRATNCHSLEMEAAPAVEPHPLAVAFAWNEARKDQALAHSAYLKPIEPQKVFLNGGTLPQPDAGSTRPEMPPDILKQVEICEQNKTKWAHFKVEDIRELLKRAASVQQEPLSAVVEKIRDVISANRSGCNEEIAEILAKLSIPAAPRTQGREPQIIRCKTCSGTIMFKPLESGEIEIYHDCPDSKKLAQARTQPSRSYEEGLFERLKDPVYAAHYTVECRKLGIEARTQPAPPNWANIICGACQIMDAWKCDPSWTEWDTEIRQGLSGILASLYASAQFFTALPEATKEEK